MDLDDEGVAHFGVSPPKLFVSAPAESGDVLDFCDAAGCGNYGQSFAFDGAFDDAGFDYVFEDGGNLAFGFFEGRGDVVGCARAGVEEGGGGVGHDGACPVPEFHVEFEGFVEGDCVEGAEARVDGEAGAEVAVATGLSVEGGGEVIGLAPGVAVVVFGPGADVGGEGFAVDVDFFVAFAPPCVGGVEEGQDVADVDAFAFYRDPVEVECAVVGGFFVGLGFDVGPLLPGGVEMAGAVVPVPPGGEDGAFGDCDGLVAQVEDRDAGGFFERHCPAAGESAVFGDGVVPGAVRADVVAGAEEVADGAPDGAAAVEGDSQDGRAEGLGEVFGFEEESEGLDCAGAFYGEGFVFTGGDSAFECAVFEVAGDGAVAAGQGLVGFFDEGSGGFEDFHGERLDFDVGCVGAVVDLVVEGFAFACSFVHEDVCLVGDFALFCVGDGQVEVVSLAGGIGLGRDAFGEGGACEFLAADEVRHRAFDCGFGFAIDVDSHGSIGERAAVGTVPRSPEADDGSGAFCVHEDVFFAAAVFFDAEEVAAVVVGPPGGGAGGVAAAIVTAELFAGVVGTGGAGERVAVEHFVQEGLEGDFLCGEGEGADDERGCDCGQDCFCCGHFWLLCILFVLLPDAVREWAV